MNTTAPDDARPAVTTLPCGCFFTGRQFCPCEECLEHSEPEEEQHDDD